MAKMVKVVRPSDLVTKRVRSPDGRTVAVKVVRSDSDSLEEDFLAAFRSNVRRVRAERRQRSVHANVASED